MSLLRRVNGFKANLPSVNKCISINAKVPDGAGLTFMIGLNPNQIKILKKILKMMMLFIKCIQAAQLEDLKG